MKFVLLLLISVSIGISRAYLNDNEAANAANINLGDIAVGNTNGGANKTEKTKISTEVNIKIKVWIIGCVRFLLMGVKCKLKLSELCIKLKIEKKVSQYVIANNVSLFLETILESFQIMPYKL